MPLSERRSETKFWNEFIEELESIQFPPQWLKRMILGNIFCSHTFKLNKFNFQPSAAKVKNHFGKSLSVRIVKCVSFQQRVISAAQSTVRTWRSLTNVVALN